MKNVSVKTSLKTEKSYFTKLLDNYPPAVYGGLYQLARYDSVKSKAFFDDACCFKNDIWNCNKNQDSYDLFIQIAGEVLFLKIR